MSWRQRLQVAEAELQGTQLSDVSDFPTSSTHFNIAELNVPPIPLQNLKRNELGRLGVGNVQELAGAGVSLAGNFAEIIFSHPFLVFRRQCQIRHDSRSLHLMPFSVVPVMRHILIQQGYGVLWKGLTSMCILRGLGMVTDTAISEVTPLPKEVTRHSSIVKMGQHLLLKGLSFAICTPFYASSLVEMVQSDVASDPPTFFSGILFGFRRCLLLKTSVSRMLPLWKIVPGVAFLELSRYAVREMVHTYTTLYLTEGDIDSCECKEKSSDGNFQMSYQNYLADLFGAFAGGLVANIVLYPLETIVNRLCVQGTRIIIDNVDTGVEVVPVTTAYDGFMDAFHTIIAEEGSIGLYKGFGALMLQYAAHFALLFAIKSGFDQLMNTYGGGDGSRIKSPRKYTENTRLPAKNAIHSVPSNSTSRSSTPLFPQENVTPMNNSVYTSQRRYETRLGNATST